jgi:type II secretory pathway pseudopilin PulG
MVAANNKGQLLVEVGVVMLLIALVAFAALNELSQNQKPFKKYQLTREDARAKKYSGSDKK